MTTCISCGRAVVPPKGWAGDVRCGACWFAIDGDYPGKMAGTIAPTFITGIGQEMWPTTTPANRK